MRPDLAVPRLLAAALLGASPLSALAQRGARAAPPAGAEIAAAAKGARLDRANVGTGEFQGKRIAFTPAALDPNADLAAGQVIGVLENEAAGDETGLPPGRYDLFAAQLADGWHVWAAADGQIVKEALRVKVEPHPGRPADARPRFRAKGWGYDIDYSGGITYEPPVATVTVSPSSLVVLMGEQKQFTIELRDKFGNVLSGRTITWTSSATGIATAPSTGVVKGVAPGTATFTATSGGKSGSATVTVPAPQYSVAVYAYRSLSPVVFTTSVPVNQAITLGASVRATQCYFCPAVAYNEIVWTSSNPSIATVQGSPNSPYATMRGVAEGPVTITAAYRGAVGTINLAVTRAPVASLTVTPAPLAVVVGQAAQLGATVRDPVGTVLGDRTVTWASANSAVADVTTTGRVIGVAVGSTTVTATSEGVSATTPVYVDPVPVSTVAVTPNDVGLGAGTYTQLETTLRDAGGNVLTGRTVTWATDNAAIADVTASGRVLAVAPGSATITATSEGKSGTATVAVPGPSSGGGSATTTSYVTISMDW